MSSRFPPRIIAWRYVLRALLLWVGVRACFIFVLMSAGNSREAIASLRAPGALAPAFIMLTGLLAPVDLSRFAERVFLGNLGVSRRAMAAAYMLAAAAGEAVRYALVGLA